MKIVAIVQARLGSTRLPNKVMLPINGVPMISLLIQRLSRSDEIDQILVATSSSRTDDRLVECVESMGLECVRDSERDVLQRYCVAAAQSNADVIVRITGDCPLMDPELVDDCIRKFCAEEVDYLSNIDPPTFPDGMDVEVISRFALDQAGMQAVNPYDREHVTPFIRSSGKFKVLNLNCPRDLSKMRWTVDEPEDYSVIKNIFS